MAFGESVYVLGMVILCIAGMSDAQCDTDRCTDIAAKINELSALVDGMCGSSTTNPPSIQQCNCHFNWTSVPLTLIGTSNLQHASTISFTIPSVIPSTANEVLIHAGVWSGHSKRGPHHDLKIFTQIGSSRYEKYLLIYTWDQLAVNTNSDNMWFPMPPNRRVYLTVPAPHGPSGLARLFAIGYR